AALVGALALPIDYHQRVYPLIASGLPLSFLLAPHQLLLFFLMLLQPPKSTLFPYTTLFRSSQPQSHLSFCVLLQYLVERKKRDRSEERFSRNAETDLVCRLLLEKKNRRAAIHAQLARAPQKPVHRRTVEVPRAAKAIGFGES